MKKNLVRLALLMGLVLPVGAGAAGCGPRLSCPIPTEMNAPGEGRVAFTLQNNTCMTICGLWISPHTCDDWGIDLLGDHNVQSGESVTVYLPPGHYDAEVGYCTQQEFIMEKLNMDSDQTWTWSDENPDNSLPCGTTLTVVNNSEFPICYFRMGNQYSERYGDNWLGDEQIAPGESRLFTLEPGTYDIKAEACDWTMLRVELAVPVSGQQVWTVP